MDRAFFKRQKGMETQRHRGHRDTEGQKGMEKRKHRGTEGTELHAFHPLGLLFPSSHTPSFLTPSFLSPCSLGLCVSKKGTESLRKSLR